MMKRRDRLVTRLAQVTGWTKKKVMHILPAVVKHITEELIIARSWVDTVGPKDRRAKFKVHHLGRFYFAKRKGRWTPERIGPANRVIPAQYQPDSWAIKWHPAEELVRQVLEKKI